MRDMIARIIEMDKAARELTQKVQKDKVNSEEEIKLLKEEIRNDYLQRARKRIEKNEKIERQEAEKRLKIISENKDNILKRLDEAYSEKKDMWVDAIVKRVLGEW